MPIDREAAALSQASGPESPWMHDGTFGRAALFAEMWEVDVMPSVNIMKALGISFAAFYDESMLAEQWDTADRDERAARLVQSIQWSNMLDDAEYGDSGRMRAMHATMRLKALGLALACDSSYGTTYLEQLPRIRVNSDSRAGRRVRRST
jgi:hypothetical protein